MIKKFTTLFIAIMATLNALATELPDSCYVYGYLHWSPSATKYAAKLELGPGKDLNDIFDANGSKLKFGSFLNALNYMASQCWEIIEISHRNPNNNTFSLEQYAIIRKKMSREKALPYISPKN